MDPNRSDQFDSSAPSAVGFGQFLAAVLLAAVVACFTVPRYLRAKERADVALARDRMRAGAMALSAYYVDHESFPPSGRAFGASRYYEAQLIWQDRRIAEICGGAMTANSFAPAGAGVRREVTFLVPDRQPDGKPIFATLTTPVAHMDDFPRDPFARTEGAALGYFAHDCQLGWIMFSFGPDRDENAAEGPGDISPRVERLYDIVKYFPHMWEPSAELIESGYDPTNGLFSEGDIYFPSGN